MDATNSAKVPDIEGVCPFFLEEGGKKRPHARMTKVRGKCLGVDIEINPDREIVPAHHCLQNGTEYIQR